MPAWPVARPIPGLFLGVVFDMVGFSGIFFQIARPPVKKPVQPIRAGGNFSGSGCVSAAGAAGDVKMFLVLSASLFCRRHVLPAMEKRSQKGVKRGQGSYKQPGPIADRDCKTVQNLGVEI